MYSKMQKAQRGCRKYSRMQKAQQGAESTRKHRNGRLWSTVHDLKVVGFRV